MMECESDSGAMIGVVLVCEGYSGGSAGRHTDAVLVRTSKEMGRVMLSSEVGGSESSSCGVRG